MNQALAKLYFKLKIYRKSGEEFQIFFSKLMSFIDSDFIWVKPHGNWGDGGNDGYNEKKKHYYQIYAPHPTTSLSVSTAMEKAVTDFDKLIDKWGVVNGYSFVLNDRYTGLSALLEREFRDFLASKSIQDGDVVGSTQLERLFNQLEDDCKLDLLEMYSLDTKDDSFEPSIIGELISHLIENSEDSLTFLSGEAPNFEEKIKFNNISTRLGHRLSANSSKVYLIEDFISAQSDDGIAQDLANKVKDIYRELREDIPSHELNRSELIYLGMKEALVPDFAKTNKLTRLGYDSVAEVIIAKYFETCDVYEDPNESNP